MGKSVGDCERRGLGRGKGQRWSNRKEGWRERNLCIVHERDMGKVEGGGRGREGEVA